MTKAADFGCSFLKPFKSIVVVFQLTEYSSDPGIKFIIQLVVGTGSSTDVSSRQPRLKLMEVAG